MRTRGLAIAGPHSEADDSSRSDQWMQINGCNLRDFIDYRRAVASHRAKRAGPGAFKHRGALHLRFKRRISDTDQFVFRTEKRVAFAFRSRGYDVWIVGGATGRAAADHLDVPRPCR